MFSGLVKQFPEWLEHSNGISQYIGLSPLSKRFSLSQRLDIPRSYL